MAYVFPKLVDVAAMQRIAGGDFVVIKESVASIDQSIKEARRQSRLTPGRSSGGEFVSRVVTAPLGHGKTPDRGF